MDIGKYYAGGRQGSTGERAPKKCYFLVKIFGLFFQNFGCGAENLAKLGTKTVLWESSENQYG